MNNSQRAELSAILSELNAVIRELEEITYHLNTDCSGIGTEHCAAAAGRVSARLYQAREQLLRL